MMLDCYWGWEIVEKAKPEAVALNSGGLSNGRHGSQLLDPLSQMGHLFSDLVKRAKYSAIKLELRTNPNCRITEFGCVSWECETIQNGRLCKSKAISLKDNTVTTRRNGTFFFFFKITLMHFIVAIYCLKFFFRAMLCSKKFVFSCCVSSDSFYCFDFRVVFNINYSIVEFL